MRSFLIATTLVSFQPCVEEGFPPLCVLTVIAVDSGPPVLHPEYGFGIGGVAPGSNPAYINSYYENGVTGLIDDVRFYDHILTANELRAVYNGLASGATVAAAPNPPVFVMPRDLSLLNWYARARVYLSPARPA